MKKRILSLLLCAVMTIGLIPTAALPALAAELAGVETIGDEYITATVSRKNGGFTIRTVEGDRLKKSDNNKDLLYHDGQYDTSFLSFRVKEGQEEKDYLFGGKYAGSSGVTVTKSTAGDAISAVWSVDDLVFTQTLSLTNESSNEHGMISISVKVRNEGAARQVQARLLLDTYLGSQDYGYYQFVDGQSQKQTVSQETVINQVPDQLYAADDPYSPSIMAYTVHTGNKPTKAAFGHWNSLAATLFDFTPTASLGFTNSLSEYMTADSAYALYYDLDDLVPGGEKTLDTFYGVFSNLQTPASNAVAVNITAPALLKLNREKTDFVRQTDMGDAHFSVAVDFNNIDSENAQTLDQVRLAVQSTGNLRSMRDDGTPADGQDFESTEPFVFDYQDVKVGESRNKVLYFQARCTDEARYERITIGVYQDEVSLDKKLGERTAYILLPGKDGTIPKVSFAAMSPGIIYNEGIRHLFVTVTNKSMLDNKGDWKMVAYSVEEEGDEAEQQVVTIPSDTITIDSDGVMDIPITETMKTGDWYLQLEWDDSVVGEGKKVPSSHAKQTAPELQFSVSSDFKYRNDGYGILTVVEYKIANSKNMRYEMKAFASQEEFDAFREKREKNPEPEDGTNYTEIVLTFKGSFTVTKKNSQTGVAYCYTAVSKKTLQGDGTYKVENPIVINDCLDFEGGTLSVYYEDDTAPSEVMGAYRGYSSAVCTEFDGELYTNVERTEVWKGKAVLTKLMQDYGNYSLAVYDEDGNRGYLNAEAATQEAPYGKFVESPNGFEGQGNEGIYLIWPSGGEIGRNLAGMIFNFTYGQFGTMYDTDGYGMVGEIVGNVLSFSAAMDMTFIQGKVDKNARGPDTYWSKIQDLWTWEFKTGALTPYVNYDEWMRLSDARDWSTIDENGENKNEKKVSGSVMVRDVLFGCGEGFVGVNFSVGATVKNYITGLPELDATIKINTVNNWSFGVDGKMELANFKIEANISFKSKDNAPVPDEIYFFIGGFEPGWNIDNMAVVWITGGGGGIKNLYDSIFATKAVPPLKLVLSVSFDLLKVLSCERATLAVGLTGVSLRAEDIGVKMVPGLTAFDHIGLALEWYPGIDMQASIGVNLFQGLVRGGGYIVLISPDYKDVFFEIFARCTLNVPDSIPVVGGMQVAGADLGINSDRIWGAIEVLCITLGVTYYWGAGSVDFSSGSKAHPTFPDLLGYDDIPVAYDEESDRTLYLRVGTNTQLLATSLPNDGSLVLMASGAVLKSNSEKTKHTFQLDSALETDAIIQITYPAESKAQAEALADQIKVGSTDGGNDYGLLRYNGSNLSTANANLTYDETTGQATYAFTVTDRRKYGMTKYGMTWYMNTPQGCEVMLYGVEETPEVKKVSGSLPTGRDQITLTWDGTDLTELDQISFYLCQSKDPEEVGHRIGVESDSTTLGSRQTTLTIPADVPSGDSYYIRAVYSKADQVNGVVFSENTVKWVNNKAPGEVNVQAAPAGNLQYELTLSRADGVGTDPDGYLVTIYEADGKTATGFQQVSFDANESGTTTINVGGSYTAEVEGENGQPETKHFGLTGGSSYVIGVTPYKKVASGTGEIALRGEEKKTETIRLPQMVTPTVSFTADKTPKSRTSREKGLLANGTVGMMDVEKKVYTADAITFTATASEPVTGTWLLDDSLLENVGEPVPGSGGSVPAVGNETVLKKDRGGEFDGVRSIPISLTELADGEHTLMVEGAADDGDSFYTTYTFVVDTQPPQLLISSPVNGSFFEKDGTVTITGITDPDARFTIACDGKAMSSNATVTELGGSQEKSTGRFSATLTLPDAHGASQHTLAIAVSDDVGNTSRAQTITVSHRGLADLQSMEVMVDGKSYSEGNVPIPVSGLENVPLALVGVTSQGTRFNITGKNVYWDIQTVEGSAGITDGKLTAGAFSQGIITGKLAVATGAFRTASLCFGAISDHTVAVSSNIGGSVTGGGVYEPGETVTLTATADKGYRFAGWTIVGIDGVDLTADTITFSMPQNGNVLAEAKFEPISAPVIGTGSGRVDSGDSVEAQAGELVKVKLPAGVSPEEYLPNYVDESGKTIFVPIAAEIDGSMVFLAPVSGTYRFGSNPMSFADVKGHWASEGILFCAQRGIFNGVGGGSFSPDGTMDRAMFATVLYRMAGSPAVTGGSKFTDVKSGQWYSDAIAWGESTGIITGYGNGRFGPTDLITREQMCTLLVRYLKWAGYDLMETAEASHFADSGRIAGWAADSVRFCQTTGLINGKPNNLFAPQDDATRAENCVVFQRMILAILRARG